MGSIETKLAQITSAIGRMAAPPRKDSKLFGRFHEVILLLLGFLLTGICGAFLTYRFQLSAKDKEQAAISVRVQLQNASDVFKDTSQAISQRLRAMTLLANTYSLDPTERSAKLPARWESYTKLLGEWNVARGYRRAMIRNLYGDSAFQEERNIHYAFRYIGERLENLSRAEPVPEPDKKTAKEAEKQLRLLQNKIEDYYYRLAEDLNGAKVGQHCPKAKATKLPWNGDSKDSKLLTTYLQ